MADSPFEIVTPGKGRKGSTKGVIIALIVVLFLALGVFVGVLLVRQNQDVREQAARVKTCPEVEACPDPKSGELVNCTPPDVGNNPSISLCTAKGRVESCGGKQYCCPSAGGTWTTNMAACPTATASATATATATASSTATATSSGSPTKTASPTATPTKTGSAAPTSTATKAPIPQTGTEWPTYLGAGVGIVVIIGAFLLAF